MLDTIFHSFRDTTFHIFRYGRSHLYAATLDRTGAILPHCSGTWRHVSERDYHEGDTGCAFNAEQALENIEADGYYLFKCRATAADDEVAALQPEIKKLLKPVDSLILELKTALERYNADREGPG